MGLLKSKIRVNCYKRPRMHEGFLRKSHEYAFLHNLVNDLEDEYNSAGWRWLFLNLKKLKNREYTNDLLQGSVNYIALEMQRFMNSQLVLN